MTDIIEENKNEELNLETALTDEKSEPLTLPKRDIVFEEALEAILFAAGHPISYATLARVFDYTPTAVKNKILRYAEKYNDSKIPRGVILLTYAESCQLCTKQYYLNEIRETLGIKKTGTLSSSAMEVLAIVAYNQPVTRIFVDTLRSVDSSYAMNSLIDRGLIECTGRLDVPGRPMLYGTTADFLRSFGLVSLDALPATGEELIAMFKKAKEADEGDAEQLSILDENGEPSENAPELENEVRNSENENSDTSLDASAEDDIYTDI